MYWENSRIPRPVVLAAQVDGGPQPSSVKVGGIRMSTMATSGRPVRPIAAAIGIAHGAGDHEAPVDQQLDQAVAQDGRIFGDDDPERGSRGHLSGQPPCSSSRRAAAGPR